MATPEAANDAVHPGLGEELTGGGKLRARERTMTVVVSQPSLCGHCSLLSQ